MIIESRGKLRKDFDQRFIRIVCDKIKERRLHYKTTSSGMADIVGVKPNTYFYYEKGDRDIPLSMIVNYCEYFNIDFNKFMNDAIALARSDKEINEDNVRYIGERKEKALLLQDEFEKMIKEEADENDAVVIGED